MVLRLKKYLLFLVIFSSRIFGQTDWKNIYINAKKQDSLGNYKEAERLYTKVIKLNPNFQNAFFNRGSIKAEQKLFEDALNDFISFDKINPNDFEVLYLQGACYYHLKDKKKSLLKVNESINLNSNFFNSLKLRGTLYLEENDYANAYKDFSKASMIRKEPEIFSLIGVCFEGLKDNKNAFKNYFIADELGYVHPLLYNNLGNMYYSNKDLNKALIYYNKALSLDTNFSICYYNKGNTLYELGFEKTAIENWKKAKKLGFTQLSPKAMSFMKD